MVRQGVSRIFFDVMVRYQTQRLIKDAKTQQLMIRGAMLDALSGIGEGLEMITMGISEAINAFDGMAVAITDSRIEFEKFFQSVSEAELEHTQNQIIGLGEAYGFTAEQALSAGSRMAQLSGIVGSSQVATGTELGMTFGMIGGMETEDAMKKMINLQAQTNFMMGELTKSQYESMTAQQQQQVLWTNSIDMMDSLNSVENTSAATMNQIIQVMNQYASQAHLTGESIGNMAAQSALLIEAGEEQGKGGRALRMIYARLGSDIGGAATSLEQYVDVTDDATGALKPLSEIIHDLGPTWDSLTAAEQQNLAQQVAGNRHYVRFIKLMENRERLLELEKNAYEKLFPALDERDKRLLDEQFQLKLVNAELENRRTLLAEKMIPALTAQREIQIAYYNAILPLLDKEQVGLGKITAHLFTGVIRANEMMRIFGGFYNAALNIANMAIALQTYQAVQRSVTTELSQFYHVMGRGQQVTSQNTMTELNMAYFKAVQTKQQNELQMQTNMNQLQSQKMQMEINELTLLELQLESELNLLKTYGTNRDQIKFSLQQMALNAGREEFELLKQNLNVKAMDVAMGNLDLQQARDMLAERQKIIQTVGMGLAVRQQELDLGIYTANLEKMGHKGRVEAIKLLGEEITGKIHLGHLTSAESLAIMKKNEQAAINNELERRGVDLAYQEAAALQAVINLKNQEMAQEEFILDIILESTILTTIQNDVKARKGQLTAQQIILEEQNIAAMLQATGVESLQTLATDKAAISAIRAAMAKKAEEQANLGLAQSAQAAAVSQMALMGGLMSATMVMGMFGDEATAMKGQMMVMTFTMGYSVVAMVKMVRQMNITITTARVLGMALGGVVLGGALMLLGSVLLPSATSEMEGFATATTQANIDANEFADTLNRFANQESEAEEALRTASDDLEEAQRRLANSTAAGHQTAIDFWQTQVTGAQETHDLLLAVNNEMDRMNNMPDDPAQMWEDWSQIRSDVLGENNPYSIGTAFSGRGAPGLEGGDQFMMDEMQRVMSGQDEEFQIPDSVARAMQRSEYYKLGGDGSLIDGMFGTDDKLSRRDYAQKVADQLNEFIDTLDPITKQALLAATTYDEFLEILGYTPEYANIAAEGLETVFNEPVLESLSLIEEFANKREELFYGGKLGNLTGSLYKNVIQQGVGTLYNHQELIVSNKFHGFFNPDQAAELIVSAIEAHLTGQSVAAAISIAE